MTLHIEICMDNAAFENDPAAEVARILKAESESLYSAWIHVGYQRSLKDTNGNPVS